MKELFDSSMVIAAETVTIFFNTFWRTHTLLTG